MNTSVASRLYDPGPAYDSGFIDVSGGHSLFFAQSGNPQGVPIINLHGGPGIGSNPTHSRSLDPSAFRIVTFDQRAAGNSRFASPLKENTTWHLVADIEMIRKTLRIESWVVNGGSWGSLLALCYAIVNPARVRALLLRGVFLGTDRELSWIYEPGGALKKYTVPARGMLETAQADTRLVETMRNTLLTSSYHDRLKAARIWNSWERFLASGKEDARDSDEQLGAETAIRIATIKSHFAYNRYFLGSDSYVLSNIKNIRHIPCEIIQGQLDRICPPVSARLLASKLSDCNIVTVPDGGHTLDDPRIAQELLHSSARLLR